MKYFTKEYIKECDCEEIRGLRKKLQKGDWYAFADTKNIYGIHLADKDIKRFGESQIWLLLSHQLDEEIVKICKEKDYTYHVNYISRENEWCIYVDGEEPYMPQVISDNPLIAKIIILKELIKDTKEQYGDLEPDYYNAFDID